MADRLAEIEAQPPHVKAAFTTLTRHMQRLRYEMAVLRDSMPTPAEDAARWDALANLEGGATWTPCANAPSTPRWTSTVATTRQRPRDE